MTELDQLSRQRRERQEKMAAFFDRTNSLPLLRRLVLLNDVLNSLIEEHNAVTEPEGRFGERTTVSTPISLLDAFDTWYAGGDIMDLLSKLNAHVPYDPMLICACLPQRP